MAFFLVFVLALLLAVALGPIRTALIAIAGLLCWLYPGLLFAAIPGFVSFIYYHFKEFFR